MRSDWMTVVWDKVELDGENVDTRNPAVVKHKRGSPFVDIYFNI